MSHEQPEIHSPPGGTMTQESRRAHPRRMLAIVLAIAHLAASGVAGVGSDHVQLPTLKKLLLTISWFVVAALAVKVTANRLGVFWLLWFLCTMLMLVVMWLWN